MAETLYFTGQVNDSLNFSGDGTASQIIATGSVSQAGPQGKDGTAASVDVGTVTTLSAGSDATVTNSGTDSAAVFEFGIPQGEPGQDASDTWGDITGTLSDQTDLQTALDTKLDISDAFSGDYDDLENKPTLGTAAATDSTAYATATQGTKADTALQSETDPVFSSSEAANITSGDITNLDNLSGTNSGDQDLSSYALTADVPTATSDLTNDSGFITSYTETDPIFTASAAHSITSTDITHLGNLSGTNTGDQTSVTGNAGTATKLSTARNINGVSFDGSADITVTDSTKVPTTRTVNGHVLSSDVTVTASDISAPVASGFAKITVGTTEPSSPSTGDLWVDTN